MYLGVFILFVTFIYIYMCNGKCIYFWGEIHWIFKLDPPTLYYQISELNKFWWLRLVLISVFISPCLELALWLHLSNIMIPLYLYSCTSIILSLSTWHDFIWTLGIRMTDLSVFSEEQGNFYVISNFCLLLIQNTYIISCM